MRAGNQIKKILSSKKILLTGGSGFLGTHVYKKLLSLGVAGDQIIIPRSKDYDLRKKSVCLKLTKQVDLVIHLAGNVGGIGKNRDLPGTLFYDNLMMGVQLIEAARINKVEKFVCIGTICAYPKFTPVPFKEESIWDGYPEETNAPYGLAKKMLLVQLQSYKQQFGFNGIYLLPVNLYGPLDNFDPTSSHVIPALIKKVLEAKRANQPYIEVWGDGSPTREFLYVEDAADGILKAAMHYEKDEPVNLGSGFEISIKNLAELIKRSLKYTGEIVWDTSKPNGQPRRKLDVSKAEKEFGFKAKTNFEEGIRKTVNWYIKYKKNESS
jgi:GDP-L-fucose synthase